MDGAERARLAGWLERPEIAALDPPRIAALAAALEADDPPATAGRNGVLIGYEPGPARRRLVEFDRRGHLLAVCRWAPDGELASASCLTDHGAWIGIEAGAATHPTLGPADRLWRLDGGDVPGSRRAELTIFQALDYRHPDAIPALYEPARLPPGAGTAVLNLIAGLMKDKGVARVRYRGPYPTEQLFTALLESFRYAGTVDDPLGRFMDGGALDWLPAPFERHVVGAGVTVHLRHGVDKVVLDDAAFYRERWQDVIRREPRLVREDGGRVVCSLVACGRTIEDRLVLDRAGEIAERPAAAIDAAPPAPLPAVWSPALAEIIARESAPALAGALREIVPRLALEWGPVPGDLVQVGDGRARLSRRLRDTVLAWVGEAAGPERAQRAIAFVVEVARLLAPAARLLAQSRLLELDPEAQAAALAAVEPERRDLPDSVGRLVALVLRGIA